MSTTGLDVFDKTLHTTNIWLNEIMETVGPDRQVAWHVLGAVLRTIRDRIPTELSVHLGSQLPILVRGIYYDQWRPSAQPERFRTRDEFLDRIGRELDGIRPVDVTDAAQAVFLVLALHLPRGQVEKVRDALPEDVRNMWKLEGSGGIGALDAAAKERGTDRKQGDGADRTAPR